MPATSPRPTMTAWRAWRPPRAASSSRRWRSPRSTRDSSSRTRSEEHTSELQSPCNLGCRLLLENKRAVGREGAERREDERAELVRRLVLVQARAAQQAAKLGTMRTATRQPGELFAQLQAHVVDPLRQSGIAAEAQRRHALTAVREIGSDLDPPGRHGDEGGSIPSLR